jgi:stage II sporulation protein D
VRRVKSSRYGGPLLLAAVAVAWAAAASCRTALPKEPSVTPKVPAPTAGPKAAPGAPDVARLAPAPSLRVAVLTEVPRVSLGADGGVVVWGQGADGAWSGRRLETARATFLSLSLGREALPAPAPPFRVQVGSFVEEMGARSVAEKATATAGLAASVRRNPVSLRFEVRLGEFPSRDEAQGVAARLHRDGFPGSFVSQDGPPATGGGKLKLVETGEELAGATVVPAVATDRLTADASPYRGAFEVRATESGLTVVNVVGLEDYLKGVVPNELSPLSFPQMEALKAQAVAARTYALRNRGQFAAKGYDLCATPTCQVYRGFSSEHPLSSLAVEVTEGQVATYGGELIDALYTSTCGGHTEDGGNIFEKEAPYLKGVACAPERGSWAEVTTSVAPRALGDDPDLTRSVGLLVSLGVLEAREYSARVLGGIPGDAEARGWGRRLTAALHRRECKSTSRASLARRGTFFEHLVGALCWEERAVRLLAPVDQAYLLKVEDARAFHEDGEREAAALLVSEGILTPFSDNSLRPAAAITRAQAFVLMAKSLEKAGPPGLLKGKFQGLESGVLRVARGDEVEAHLLAPALRLFRNLGGATAAASEVSLSLGDEVKYVLQDGRVAYLEVAQSRHGTAADRDSRYYRWEVRASPAEVAQGVSRYGRVGLVRDLEPRRLGVSGRVVELVVRGSEGDLLLRGLRVRWGLGLRENLFVIERERDVNGAVVGFVFTGKGWGHGVGLCQVGAFGMAQAGSSHEEILKHYYSGISLGARE